MQSGYLWRGSRKAVDEYFHERGMAPFAHQDRDERRGGREVLGLRLSCESPLTPQNAGGLSFPRITAGLTASS